MAVGAGVYEHGPAVVHAMTGHDVLEELGGAPRGLGSAEAGRRLLQQGPNLLPEPRDASLLRVFLRQFRSPFIYVLVFASVLSLRLGHWVDAGFIGAVLVLNSMIGTSQEYRAAKGAQALRTVVGQQARVVRDGDVEEIAAVGLVPGDVVLLASGDKVPADLRLLRASGLFLDESTLTGESLAVEKDAVAVLPPETGLADRVNCACAGTLVTHGRGEGVVTATGGATVLGGLAQALVHADENEPPLMTRMRQMTWGVAAAVAVVALVVAVVERARGSAMEEALLIAVALAVSAIPEGLPVALTVALAIATARMGRRHVIVRRLVAVEALGSCTLIASDKTGTLTVNELTVTSVALPEEQPWSVTGAGSTPVGEVRIPGGVTELEGLVRDLARAAVLCNEAVLAHRGDTWTHQGDAVDVALLVFARKLGLRQSEVRDATPVESVIAYEPERGYAACRYVERGTRDIAVKGAFERLLPMCDRMTTRRGTVPIDPVAIVSLAERMAADGQRVLAICAGAAGVDPTAVLEDQDLRGLSFLGLVGMTDPVRPEARDSITLCREAGVVVDMVTGDHPATALAVARELGLADRVADVVTGAALRDADRAGRAGHDALIARSRVFARVEPQQKLEIVRALSRQGHVVAVTGDGANDAPALRQAHVGVAMGRSGTDVARESAELILTDDRFSSIAAGVEEGRVAYGNVRKVIQLLVATGAGEVVLILLAVAAGLPLPVVAVQLLWLNLVTNGIQDVALAFEPPEGTEMRRRPRPPREPIFNRLMVERVLVVAAVLGTLAFVLFAALRERGATVEDARSSVVLMLVLGENVLALSARSETRSIFRTGVTGNRVLMVGVGVALAVHVLAMYVPWTQRLLGVSPVSAELWLVLVGMVLLLLVAVEAHKYVVRRRESQSLGLLRGA